MLCLKEIVFLGGHSFDHLQRLEPLLRTSCQVGCQTGRQHLDGTNRWSELYQAAEEGAVAEVVQVVAGDSHHRGRGEQMVRCKQNMSVCYVTILAISYVLIQPRCAHLNIYKGHT